MTMRDGTTELSMTGRATYWRTIMLTHIRCVFFILIFNASRQSLLSAACVIVSDCLPPVTIGEMLIRFQSVEITCQCMCGVLLPRLAKLTLSG